MQRLVTPMQRLVTSIQRLVTSMQRLCDIYATIGYIDATFS
jgi:hypothetical protein